MTKKFKKLSEENHAKTSLNEALKFISPIQKNQAHCILKDKWCVASDNILSIGHKIDEEIEACPHIETLAAALSKCGETISITQLDKNKLSIKSDKLKALVKCVDIDSISITRPDAPIAPINDKIKQGFEVLNPIIGDEKQKFISDCSVLLRAGSMIGTNRVAILEYWHGIDLPPNILIPKVAMKAVCKTDKKLVSFGFSSNSFTFYFEDESFIKTQLYVEEFPNCDSILNAKTSAWPLPPNFFKAVDTLMPFLNEKSEIYFEKGMLQTELNSYESTTYEIEGLKPGPAFNCEILKKLEHCIKTIDFSKYGIDKKYNAYFFGDNVRGVLAGLIKD